MITVIIVIDIDIVIIVVTIRWRLRNEDLGSERTEVTRTQQEVTKVEFRIGADSCLHVLPENQFPQPP